MSILVTGVLATLAKGALSAVVSPLLEEAKSAAVNAAQDTIRGKIAGRMSAEEWAGIVVVGVDSVKDRAVTEGNLRYVGGEIRFTRSRSDPNAVTASFQLFFLNPEEKWQKAEAACDIPAARFTLETLEEIDDKEEIKYAVE